MHRGVHELSERATDAYEAARERVRALLQRRVDARDRLHAQRHRGHQPGGAQLRAAAPEAGRRGAHLRDGAPLEHRPLAAGRARRRARRCAWRRSTTAASCCSTSSSGCSRRARACVAITHMSNALGTVTPVARDRPAGARRTACPVLVDASQAAYHMRVDVRALDCDFLVATGHKLYGPTGIGVLYGKAVAPRGDAAVHGRRRHDQLRHASRRSTWNVLPYKFEAGTPNIAGAVGLARGARLHRRRRPRRDRRARARPARVRHAAARVDRRRADRSAPRARRPASCRS